MAAATDFWSLSGRPQEYIPSGTKQIQTGGAESTNSSTSQSQTSSTVVNKQNTPGGTLEAIQQLLAQLTERPNISEADLNVQAPLPQLSKYAIYSTTSHNSDGSQAIASYDFARYNRDLALAQQKREQLQKNSGMTSPGTAETKAQQGQINTEIQSNRENQAKYSKEAAFNDASALSNKFSRQLLEQVMPAITKATESSGTSGGAVRGILSQDAAARVAEAQASLGLNAAAQYGQVSNQLATILASLSTSSANTPVLNALLNLMNISKGTVEQGVTNTTSSGEQNTTSNTNKQATSTETDKGNPNLLLVPALQQMINSVGNFAPAKTQVAAESSTRAPAVAPYNRTQGFAIS